jgi:hypothetical protein
MSSTTQAWLLLLYSLPSKQGAARLSLWRQLKRIGAVSLKTSASVLPDRPDLYEAFQWLGQRVREQGGEATLVRAASVDGIDDQEVIVLFQKARADDYQEIIDWVQQHSSGKGKAAKAAEPDDVEKMQAKLAAIRSIDFFECPRAKVAEMQLRQLSGKQGKAQGPMKRLSKKDFVGRTWLTRPRPEVDRVGSAWLIKRFIDEKARFVFGANAASFPSAIPYDMVDVEFGHHGDDCSFETLVKRFGIAERGVAKLAEVIHDADLGDGKFGRTEGTGLLAILRGWAVGNLSDDEILARGFECFDALHQAFSRRIVR